MAVTILGAIRRHSGLSTDAKPTYRTAAGSTFYEEDTGRTYVLDGGGHWLLQEHESIEVMYAAVMNELRETNRNLRRMCFALAALTDVDLAEVE
jgi:hypothetical protein